ncbi:RNA polymerase sigma factor [Ornithinibacillus bavariensis]|uniref:RNA polymerase sigma factor n=1 Tax=Ornithinibacillus bavariensis TaxID=545502 RepID=UPI000EBE3701|nr:RNA polymerase subunit sigma-70 [Ornithinibacillus sp.]
MDWEELYHQYSDHVFKFIYFMVGNKGIAEDLTHDTYVRVEKALPNYRGESSYYTWIISIARNVTNDFLRRSKKIRFIPFENNLHDSIGEKVEDRLIHEESTLEVMRMIHNLKLNYRNVIILRKIQELSVEETAEALGWSSSKVKSTTYRAMEKLRKELHYPDNGEEA